MDTIIQAKGLHKIYGETIAVDNITFEIQRGEIFGMLGPNGAGKTTTIECIEGLRQPDGGTVQVFGLDPQRNEYEIRERIGIQFQSAALPARIKVGEALELFSSFYQHRVEWPPLLEKIGLADKKDALVSKLSGGQQQRVFIALALINDPELVFMDELTTGLDPQSRRAMWDMILDMRTNGKTIFLTTHFMEEAERLCDRVAIVDHGKIIALDTPANLIASLNAENRVIFNCSNGLNLELLKNSTGVIRVERLGERVIVYGKKEGLLSGVVNTLETNQIPFSDLRTEQPSLEDVFLALTGKEMRN
ncbi:MAG: multidrug ABC transporter ATP-binding protein [Chloroflexi bacterium HGW-Chloroflexi-10]|nr:MAG: multidrug ABC transporter ATP-binding protein [Chloroflexi bacterium HGW-Chloroflexi-10]